jgi:hypothetical protein
MTGRGKLRRAVSLAAMTHNIPVAMTPEGVDTGVGGVAPWDTVQGALGAHSLSSPTAVDRLASWLKLRHRVALLSPREITSEARVIGFPCDHPRHPGDGWVVQRLHGGALDLGLGLRGLDPGSPLRVVALSPSLWASLGMDPLRHWRTASMMLEHAGAAAACRMQRHRDGLIEGNTEADAVTLLGSAHLRAHLAETHAGMATIAMPTRSRGWTRLSAVDPAFAPSAAQATSDPDRGFTRVLLVTREEVGLAAGGRWAVDAATGGLLETPDFALRG